jgi:UDP-N-acetylmuramyl pentapeptide phosphotransferase/UDP-N-acetylglucosamine-1-phosphate transferase
LAAWASLAATFPLALYFAGATGALILSCALGLALVSLLDDCAACPWRCGLARTRSPRWSRWRSRSHAAGSPATHWLAWIAALGAIAWMTNLYNFMEAPTAWRGRWASSLRRLRVGGIPVGAGGLGITCLALASANVGFLVHNFPPARVFMGDAGSIPLGFLAGALGVQGSRRARWDAAFPLLVFSPFIVDASVTLLLRLARRERVWQATARITTSAWCSRDGIPAAAVRRGWTDARRLGERASPAWGGCHVAMRYNFFLVALYALLLPAIDRKTRRMTAAAR